MSRGGAREGAGRPKGSGKFGEPTMAIRIPVSQVEGVMGMLKSMRCPLYESNVAAGFPSPAEDAIAGSLDLNEFLIRHPAATFFVRASGVSMVDVGIFDGDILVVDRSLNPVDGKIVIAAINGELTVKRFCKEGTRCFLRAENESYQPIELVAGMELHIWGVVTSVIHKL
jgi:DNA polymerase V